MKKIVTILLAIMLVLATATVFAVEETNQLEEETQTDVLAKKQQVESEINEYTEKYGSETYGTVAYVLNKVRFFSIPICFVGIVIGALFQYVLGTRRLDLKHRGFAVIICSVTILCICQVLPLIFTLVVVGWRG